MPSAAMLKALRPTNTLSLMLVLLLGFAFSAATTFVIIRLARAHLHVSGDMDMSGPQKFHGIPVPRVGGLGIVIGLIAALLSSWGMCRGEASFGLILLACAVPAFLGGLAEDLTKRQSPRRRLFFTAVSAGLAAWVLDAVIHHTDIPGLDWVMSFAVPAVLLTMFAVTGVANAVNIIDGFNGLAAMCVVLMLIAMTYVAIRTGDSVIGLCGLAGLGAVMGFFIWNFPSGLIFLGDGGAYFLGFYVAELSVLLLLRNPDVSPLFPLLMCIYPIFETLFSIYRRKFVRGRAVGMPDGVHLHSLIYRRLMRWTTGNVSTEVLTKRNSLTAPYLWFLCALSVIPATFFWNSSLALALFIVLFGVTYVFLYGRIVRFKVPRWLIVRR